jgi:LPS-assembly protein
VGLVEANPIDWMGLTQRFRLDNATWTPRRVDSSLRLGVEDKALLRVAYSFLADGPEELSSSFETPLTYLGMSDNWKLITGTQHDLADSRLLQGEAGLRYTTDCYEIELVARRRGFSNADLQPSTDYLLNIQLLTFGL